MYISKISSMIGEKFVRLYVIERDNNDTNKVVVKCECGKEYSTNAYAILKGRTKSCGCLKNEGTAIRNIKNSTHGLSQTPLYHIYNKILYRCQNQKSKDYKHYGAKGIKVCDEWTGENGIFNFHKWSSDNGYEIGLSIDRIDSNGDYEPLNCRWVTMSENIGKRNKEYAEKQRQLKRNQETIEKVSKAETL